MSQVSMRDVWRRFGSFDAVKNLSLDIDDGEFVVLVGPSGCGKSTTLRMIAGLEEVSSGEIRFDRQLVNDLQPNERNIAMVFQSYALYPHMSVERNMSFALEQRRMPKDRIRETVDRTARMLGITELLQRKPKQLSGGQRQRVAMGRAIVRQPDVFLFDEPLSNLDAALRMHMRTEIKKLHAMLSTTTIYVTHDQIEAMTMADRIVVMNKGEVVQVGDPETIYNRPRTRFVAGFIGSPPINFVPARIRPSSQGLAAELGSGLVLDLPGDRRAALERLTGREVELGIRPEHISVASGQEQNGSGFTAVVDVLEPLGADTLAVFSLAGTDVTARCRPGSIKAVGQRVPFSIEMSRVHVIEPETGLNVLG